MAEKNIPYIETLYDKKAYQSRFTQVSECLNNINYNNYDEAKIDGYKAAIFRYLSLANANKNNLKPLDEQIAIDLKDGRQRQDDDDDYGDGYFLALLLIREVLLRSKVARFREVGRKVNG